MSDQPRRRDDGQLEDGVLVRVWVPLDIRIVGFDDNPMLRAMESVWEQNLEEKIDEAVEETDFYFFPEGAVEATEWKAEVVDEETSLGKAFRMVQERIDNHCESDGSGTCLVHFGRLVDTDGSKGPDVCDLSPDWVGMKTRNGE